jgi:spermidine/putrescine-binding protein
MDESQLEEATNLLIEQKPLVYSYEVDGVRDLMIDESAALAVIYSGEALFTQSYNENLSYVVPKEGSNMWIDAWVIPKNCQNKEGAEAWINFLCRPILL